MITINNKMKNFFQENENASTAKIAVWYVIANIVTKGFAMLSTPIFTRLMSQSEYGQFSTFTSWESIIMILVTLDLTTSISRAKYDFEGRMNEYISSILVCSNIVTFMAYFIVELNHNFFENLFSIDMTYIRMLFVYLLFVPHSNTSSASTAFIGNTSFLLYFLLVLQSSVRSFPFFWY